jgi:tetratricopeptide (TPR) repeat protein
MDESRAISLLSVAEESAAELRGLDAKAWIARMETEYRDLEAALDWFLEHGRANEALRMAASLPNFWSATGRLEQGHAWLDRALAAPVTDEILRGNAFFQAGLLAFWQGEDERARSLHDQALEIGRRLGDPTVIALALSGLARIALREDIEQARALCKEALEVSSGTDDKIGRSSALHVLGVSAQMAGDLEEARELMTMRLDLARELGDLIGVSGEASNLSVVERQLGNLQRAEELALEALRISGGRGDEWAIPYNLNALAAVSAERGALERAATLLGAAEAMVEHQGAGWPPDEGPHYERTKARLVEEMKSDDFARFWEIGRGLTLTDAVRYALDGEPR